MICGIDSLKGVSTDILTLCIQTAESFQTCRSKRRRRRRRSIGKWKRIVLFLPVNAYFSKLDPLTFRRNIRVKQNDANAPRGVSWNARFSGIIRNLIILVLVTKNFDNFELCSCLGVRSKKYTFSRSQYI